MEREKEKLIKEINKAFRLGTSLEDMINYAKLLWCLFEDWDFSYEVLSFIRAEYTYCSLLDCIPPKVYLKIPAYSVWAKKDIDIYVLVHNNKYYISCPLCEKNEILSGKVGNCEDFRSSLLEVMLNA